MGNYKKTVRCSFCGEHGHNKISCVKLKEYVEATRELYGSDHPIVVEHDLSKAKYSSKSSKNANKKRLCTYCFESGHNRRTCSHLKKHRDSLIEKNYQWRRSILSVFRENGVGVGSLLSYNNAFEYGWSNTYPNDLNSKDLWMIVKINWPDINFFESCDYSIVISLVKRPSTKKSIGIESLIMKYPNNYHNSDSVWNIVSRAHTENKLPEGWLSSDSTIVNKVGVLINDLTKDTFEKIFVDGIEDNILLSIVEGK